MTDQLAPLHDRIIKARQQARNQALDEALAAIEYSRESLHAEGWTSPTVRQAVQVIREKIEALKHNEPAPQGQARSAE